MSITLRFPTVMKMEFQATINVDESTKLLDLKETIFNLFWERISPFSARGKHGDVSGVILRGEDCAEITSDDMLYERIKASPNFEVVFREHL